MTFVAASGRDRATSHTELPSPEANAGPAAAPADGERLPALDLIRGVAILLILPANMPVFSGFRTFFGKRDAPETDADGAVHLLTLFFVDHKFITLLSILFGVGLAIQQASALRRGKPFAGYYLRRMALLFLIGLAHGVLLWDGDILLTYSLVGIAALALSGLGRRGTLIAIALGLAWGLGWTVFGGAFDPAFASDQPLQRWEDALPSGWRPAADYFSPHEQTRVFRDGTFGAIVVNNAILVALFKSVSLPYYDAYLLACFLLGVYLFRRGVFDDPGRRRRYVRLFLAAGLGLGVPLHVAAVAASLRPATEGLAEAAVTLGAPPMALGYLGLLLLWDGSGRLPGWRRLLEGVGRMALSNYVFQSVVCVFLFYSPGLRLYGQVDRATALGIVLAIWVVQIALSAAWLRAFRMGPVEWVWRSLAEGKRMPFLRRA